MNAMHFESENQRAWYCNQSPSHKLLVNLVAPLYQTVYSEMVAFLPLSQIFVELDSHDGTTDKKKVKEFSKEIKKFCGGMVKLKESILRVLANGYMGKLTALENVDTSNPASVLVHLSNNSKKNVSPDLSHALVSLFNEFLQRCGTKTKGKFQLVKYARIWLYFEMISHVRVITLGNGKIFCPFVFSLRCLFFSFSHITCIYFVFSGFHVILYFQENTNTFMKLAQWLEHPCLTCF